MKYAYLSYLTFYDAALLTGGDIGGDELPAKCVVAPKEEVASKILEISFCRSLS